MRRAGPQRRLSHAPYFAQVGFAVQSDLLLHRRSAIRLSDEDMARCSGDLTAVFCQKIRKSKTVRRSVTMRIAIEEGDPARDDACWPAQLWGEVKHPYPD